MKKLFAILLALAMIFAMNITAFAAEDEETTLTVTPAADGVTRTYVGHMLLKLESMSLKPEVEHDCNGTLHKETCYYYAYSMVDKYKEVLQHETWEYAGTGFWGNTEKPDESAITVDQVVEYLASLSSDSQGYGTLRKVADRIYRAIKEARIAPDTVEFTQDANIEKGYWIFADVTVFDPDAQQANSLVIVDTLGKDDITITPKTSLPSAFKKVQDIDDSEQGTIANNNWVDSADHDFGDVVPFKLTATLPDNVQYYETYTLTFHDTLSSALRLCTEGISKDKPFKVLMYGDIGTANADHDLNVGTDVTELFEIEYPGDGETCACGNTCSFKFVGDIYNVENANTTITPATVFVVYYEAELLKTANLGNVGNPNKMHLEYSNNPYDATTTGFTAEDTVIVFTYSFTVQKVDQDGAALPGAGFTLYKLDANGRKNKIGEMQGGEDSDLTEFTWTGLDDGDYVLEETIVPKGFNGMAAREFSIYADHDLTSDAPQLTSLGSTSFVGNTDDGTIVAQVANRTGAALPETGAEGTFFLITGSTLLVLVAAVFMITRKKMSIYED